MDGIVRGSNVSMHRFAALASEARNLSGIFRKILFRVCVLLDTFLDRSADSWPTPRHLVSVDALTSPAPFFFLFHTDTGHAKTHLKQHPWLTFWVFFRLSLSRPPNPPKS